MVSFLFIAALWPIATSFALPCAEQPSTPGMTCHDLPQPDGTFGSILINDRLRARNLSDVHSETAVMVTRRDGDPPHFQRAGKSAEVCGEPSYYFHEWEQPQFADCDAIEQWAISNNGLWILSEEDQPASPASIVLYQVNTCAFSVVMDPETKTQGVSIGNIDVAAILQEQLHDGYTQTGARGTMECNFNTGSGHMLMRWWIATPSTAQDVPDLHGLTN
ncbi:hypothetical protein GGR53DRAFT_470210 [Hypoxylon sp. FL1150]|nr:hypothetical protein GGR53DRAFT_470210 [Hypoxylon sp. FL1150]